MASTSTFDQKAHRRFSVWLWLLLSLVIVGAAGLIAGRIVLKRADPILKGRVIETLSNRFQSKVELDDFEVSIGHGIEATGKGLRIFAPDDVVAAGATKPLIAIDSFEFHASILGLYFKPTHVGMVRVQGLAINIPPRGMRTLGAADGKHHEKIKILVDEIVCDNSRLVIGNANPNKDPKLFELKHIVLHDFGPTSPWPYDATLTNAIPRGDIHATGSFGPWNTESPGDSNVSGTYTFDHADLNTIKGIAGTLSSKGEFDGRLNRIAIHGETQVPDFSLDTANHPMPLQTKFEAIVDGTSGDTYLQKVDAVLGKSQFSCSGAVVNVKGVGHQIDLDVNVPGGRIQDFLRLAVKTEPPVMTGVLSTLTKLHIRPGHESVSQKMTMQGQFTLQQIHFTNPAVEDKVDMLSLRAQGDPQEAKPGAPDVHSRMTGGFTMNHGELNFERLDYSLPGASVQLAGVYSMDGKKFDFHGVVRTQATVSQMVASRWKSWMLKAVDPFFRKNGAGAQIPITISGTQSAPKFGLDFGKMR
jgi:hypothetical protein